ncbi:MAG: cobalamin-dependent protein [Elusimicrobiota bacterium]
MTGPREKKFRAVLVPPLHAEGMVPLAAGLLKAAAMKDPFLRRRCEITILEPWASPKEAAGRVCALGPDLVGFTLYGDLPLARAAAREIKRRCSAKVVFGGPLVGAADPEELLRDGAADMAAAGEGETVFVELLKRLVKKEGPAGVRGLSFVGASGRVETSPPAAPLADLSRTPSPYLSGVFGWRRYPRAPLETSRGCAERCLYCSVSRRVSGCGRSRAAAELRRVLRDQPELRTLFLTDPDVCRSPGARDLLRTLGRELGRRGVNAEIQVSLVNLTPGLAAALNDAAFSLGAGVQSVSARTCRLAGRRSTPPMLEMKAGLLARAAPRARTVLSFIIGLPGDRHEDCLSNFEWGLSRNAGLFFHRLRVYPGTPLGRARARFGVEALAEDPYFVTGTADLPAGALRRVLRTARELAPAANIVHADKFFGFLFRHMARSSGGADAFPGLRLCRRVNALAAGIPAMSPALSAIAGFRDDGDWSGLEPEALEGSRDALISGLAGLEKRGPRRAFAERYADFCRARLFWEKLDGARTSSIFKLASGGGLPGRALLVCGAASSDPGRFSPFGVEKELLVEEKFGNCRTLPGVPRLWADRPGLSAAAPRAGAFANIIVSQVLAAMPGAGREKFLAALLAAAAPGARLFVIDSGLGYPDFGPDWELTGGWNECSWEDTEGGVRAAGWRLLSPVDLGRWRVFRAVRD